MGSCRPHWDRVPDDTWAQVFGHLSTRDKLALEQTCQRFNTFFKHPRSKDTWGRLKLLASSKVTEGNHVWRLCDWVQPRLAGITAVCFHGVHDPDKPDEEQLGIITLWHALVALTSDTDVRLRLRSEPAVWRKSPTDCMRLLSAPSRTELVQRLTALDVCVWEADNVTAVYSLAALRHLRLWSAVKNTALEMFAIAPGAEPPPCQLSELRTLQLHDIWPEAFFTPGVGASLQQLRSVCLRDCLFEEHMPDVPDELLRLPSLERLELIRLPLLCLPDMRELPALRTLVVSDGPVLRFDFAPMGIFGRATALTHLSLHDTPVEDRRLLMSLSACRT